MTKLEKNQEKNRSNTRKTRWKKMRTIAWIGAFAIGTTFMTSCGTSDSDLTKLSKEHDDAVENVTTQKEELETAKEELKAAQEKVKEEQQDVVDAQKEETELRVKLQKEKVNPAK